MKEDLSLRMQLFFKHIYDIMNSSEFESEHDSGSRASKTKSRSPGSNSKSRPDVDPESRKVYKGGSEVYITSNRSGASTKSSKARKSTSQSRKSKPRRKSSNKKRNRRYANDNATLNDRILANSINNSFGSNNPFQINKRLKENSLPALTAIYGNSVDVSHHHNRRNNSGLAAIDLSNQRKRKMNFNRVYNTVDVKSYPKTNSLSMVVPSHITRNLKNSLSSKKSPDYGKRNMSLNNNRTFDDRGQVPETMGLLDLDSKLSLLSKNPKTGGKKFNNIGNHRYKLRSLIDQKQRNASNRK